jgi:hypothetical protein
MAWDTPTTATVGQVLTAAFWNAEVKGNMDYLKGGMASYTPQVDQGASTNILKTVNEARYSRTGDFIDVSVYLTLTASGTSGSSITFTIPVAATGYAPNQCVGAGMYYRSAITTEYAGTMHLASTTQIAHIGPAATNAYTGQTPSFQAVANDQIRAQLRVHVA